VQTLSAEVVALRGQLQQQQQQHQEQQLLMHAALAQATTMKQATAMTDITANTTAMSTVGSSTSINSKANSSSCSDISGTSQSLLQPLALQQLSTASSGNSFDKVTSASISAATCSMADAAENMCNTDLTPQHTAATTRQTSDKQASIRSQNSVTELVGATLTASTNEGSSQSTVNAASSVVTYTDDTSTSVELAQDNDNIDSTDQTFGVKRAVCADTVISDSTANAEITVKTGTGSIAAVTAHSTDDTLQFTKQSSSNSSSNDVALLTLEQQEAQQQPAAKRAKTTYDDIDLSSYSAQELTANSSVFVSSSSSSSDANEAAVSSKANMINIGSAGSGGADVAMIKQSGQAVGATVGVSARIVDTIGTVAADMHLYHGNTMDTQLTSNLMLLMSNTRAGHFTEQFRAQQAVALVTAWNAAKRGDVCGKLEMLKYWCTHGHIDEQFRRAQAEQAWTHYVQQQQS
jgi:hypothetical protein